MDIIFGMWPASSYTAMIGFIGRLLFRAPATPAYSFHGLGVPLPVINGPPWNVTHVARGRDRASLIAPGVMRVDFTDTGSGFAFDATPESLHDTPRGSISYAVRFGGDALATKGDLPGLYAGIGVVRPQWLPGGMLVLGGDMCYSPATRVKSDVWVEISLHAGPGRVRLLVNGAPVADAVVPQGNVRGLAFVCECGTEVPAGSFACFKDFAA